MKLEPPLLYKQKHYLVMFKIQHKLIKHALIWHSNDQNREKENIQETSHLFEQFKRSWLHTFFF